jgi:hypothetical protein
MPRPFVIGYFDGTSFIYFWGPDCLGRFTTFLESVSPRLLYAHNGGRFDFLFLLDKLKGRVQLINGRIVCARLGRHTLRDSFAILPVALSAYQKEEIDYGIMEDGQRDRPANRDRIVDYLRSDCVNLHDLVRRFRERFGDRLTIAGTAIRELAKHHTLTRGGPVHDANFRRFYFGGRVECFAVGVVRGNWQVADVNSMYPHAMRSFDHPASLDYRVSSTLDLSDPALCFAVVDATSLGALPLRTREGLEFPHGRFRFNATSHELRAALELGVLEIHECLGAWYCAKMQRFDSFVDYWIGEKIKAEEAGNKAGRIFAKLIANSAYGKTAQDPSEYRDWTIRDTLTQPPPGKLWDIEHSYGTIEVWSKPAPVRPGSYYDVAVGASITGAGRAVLFRALAGSVRPVYCDTDSIICEKINAPIHPTRLGAWKIEARGTRIALAGKKTYALFQGKQAVKFACKGVDISPKQIETIAKGGSIDFFRDAPTMSIRGNFFIRRTVKATAKLSTVRN